MLWRVDPRNAPGVTRETLPRPLAHRADRCSYSPTDMPHHAGGSTWPQSPSAPAAPADQTSTTPPEASARLHSPHNNGTNSRVKHSWKDHTTE